MKNSCPGRDYPEFINYVKEHILDYMSGQAYKARVTRAEIVPMIKNNETVTAALQIYEDGPFRCPMIGLDDFYEQYSIEGDLDEAMHSIVRTYENSREQEYFMTPDELTCFESIKSKIIVRLVSREKNSHFLEECPYRMFLDMAVTYRILSGKTQGGISTVFITRSMMENWGVSEPVLYTLALENSVRLFPPQFHSMMSILSKACEGNEIKKDLDRIEKSCYDSDLYVGTNDCGINGASILCYPNVLEDFAGRAGCDFYILPSSVHEVILLSARKDILPETLASMVFNANQSMVSGDDYLSDSIYYYSIPKKQIEILCPSFPKQAERAYKSSDFLYHQPHG